MRELSRKCHMDNAVKFNLKTRKIPDEKKILLKKIHFKIKIDFWFLFQHAFKIERDKIGAFRIFS